MNLFIKTLQYKNIPVHKDTVILDFGCGNGGRVQQMREGDLQAFGCDLTFKVGPDVETLKEKEIIRYIKQDPYKLPFEDNKFDYIISNAVFEHVQNKEETLAELNRILKPGGVMVHYFPSKYGFIESHVYVPFASVLKSIPYLYFWALLGIRKKNQKDMDARAVALANQEYLNKSTHYSSTKEITDLFSSYFADVKFIEKDAMRHHHSKAMRMVAKYLLWAPPMSYLFRTFKAVVVFCVKP